jgi:hypothetical protein
MSRSLQENNRPDDPSFSPGGLTARPPRIPVERSSSMSGEMKKDRKDTIARIQGEDTLFNSPDKNPGTRLKLSLLRGE